MLQLEKLKAEDKIIEKLLIENPEVKLKVIEVVKQSQFSQYNRNLSEEENMKNPMVRASFRNKLTKQYPDLFKDINTLFSNKIQTIKAKLRLL